VTTPLAFYVEGHSDYLFTAAHNELKAIGRDVLNRQPGEEQARLAKDLLSHSEMAELEAGYGVDVRNVNFADYDENPRC
jgi:hypothetical protein